MLNVNPIAVPEEALAEAKQYLRVELADEDGLLARSIGASAELCEQFTGQRLLARSFAELLPASPAWRRLAARPVRAITGVETLEADGTASALPAASYAIDIDAAGDGWMRLAVRVEAAKVRVTYEAGIAAAEAWDAIPDTLRHGVIRLTAHLYRNRDDENAARPPAAVTALWRPWRRLRIG